MNPCLLRPLRAVSVLVLMTAPAVRAATPVEQVDAIVREEMERQHITGLALAVVRTGVVVQATGHGLADREHGVKVGPETAFKIGSISKQFIATGVMLLAEEGKLGLDDPVSAHLEGTPGSWADITLRHLLSHTAGLVRECPDFNRWEPVSDEEAVRSAYPLPLVFPTGSRYQYSNCGYFALAEVITRRAGRPWAAFLETRVFKPAGLGHTRTTSTTELIPRRARGYAWHTNGWHNTPDYNAVRPSGAFISTVLDLARWETALVRAEILSKGALEKMWTPTALAGGGRHSYGLGWSLEPFEGRRRAEHSGALPGFRSHYLRLPEEGLAVIVLSNEESARPLTIAERVAKVHLSPTGR